MIDHKVILDKFGPWGWRLAHFVRIGLWWVLRPQRVGVVALILNPQGQVLLVENSYAPGLRLPAGGVERGEAAVTALHREVVEETGLTPLQARLFGIYHHSWLGASNHNLLYVVDAFTGEPRADGNEILRVVWADPANLPSEVVDGVQARLGEVLYGVAPSPRW